MTKVTISFHRDENIHNEDKFQKYVHKYCDKCDPLEYEDCQCRRTTYEKKMCLLARYVLYG